MTIWPKYHKVGSLDLTCKYCGKELSAKRSLNTHVRTMHMKSFKYPCPVLNCDWRTDAKGLLQTHMVKQHGEEPTMEYRCDLCHKLFDGDNLKRHKKAAMCQVAKNVECTQCTPPQVVQIEGKDDHPHKEVPHQWTWYSLVLNATNSLVTNLHCQITWFCIEGQKCWLKPKG